MPSGCREIAEEKGIKEIFGVAAQQMEYMNKIVSDLHDYAGPIEPNFVETSVRQLIDDTLSTVTIPRDIEISLKIEENFPKVMADPSLMKRVFTNLVTNALQAMPKGGKLTMEASQTKDAISLSIQDTGVGISEENLEKLFQPLFTTKPKGQGFGLAVCKRLIEAHDGTITVKSRVGKGCTFTVKIPIRNPSKQHQ